MSGFEPCTVGIEVTTLPTEAKPLPKLQNNLGLCNGVALSVYTNISEWKVHQSELQ